MYRIKIGVVEDEMVIADTICLALRKLGYEVSTASPNYQRAIKMVEEERPDLLLIDVNLGGVKDGIHLAEYIRSKYQMPLIFLTANSDATTVERAKKVRPNAYLVKPFNKNDLFTAIEIAVSNFSEPNDNINPMEYMMVKDGYDFIKVFLYEIICIQSDQNYAVFDLKNGKKLMVRSTIGEMMGRLPAGKFRKINRGTIINLAYISKIQTDKVQLGEKEFSVNKEVRDELLSALGTI